MKKTISAILSAIIISTATCSCIRISKKDYGPETTKTITVSENFTGIESYAMTDVEFTQGPLSITLTAPEKIIDKIEVKVEDGILKVGYKEPSEIININDLNPSKLVVSAPSVGSFISTGTGDFTIKGIDVKEIFISSTGTGDIDLKTARCTKITASSYGTGDIDINYLSCLIADFNTSGTGDIGVKRISADKVSGQTSGTGDITISGECKETSFNASGTGDINHKGLEIIKETEED